MSSSAAIAAATAVVASKSQQNVGHITEYIADRVYLAAYTSPPNDETHFPYSQKPSGSPTKRSRQPARQAAVRLPPYYFTVDNSLEYNAFHHDFGPFHIGHLYRFAVEFHDILGATENKDRPVVFWSYADSKSRANAACLLACYMVLVQGWPPHLALCPIAQIDPPLMPFRDAGYSQADYSISIQDVVYGVWKAKEQGVCSVDTFDLAEYELHERVDQGDFNWVTPDFLAFASPQHKPVARISESDAAYSQLPRSVEEIRNHATLPNAFKEVLTHFSTRNIGLVVRLNDSLYSPSFFEALGIQHLDMVFDDGTCPTMPTVRKFIRIAHETIVSKKKAIAVHCKAGLGRTGCLIGAYLIYRYGFTANEIIAFMRFMRPGMVVGPQQHWLHIHQGTFREWYIEERCERRLRRAMASSGVPSTPVRAMQNTSIRAGQASTPPNRSASNRTPLSEVDKDRTNIAVQEEYLPAPTPGQPRKATRTERHHPYSRGAQGGNTTTVEEEGVDVETEIMTMQRRSQGAESDEEIHLRMRSHRSAHNASSQQRQDRTRSVSQTTTTTTVYHEFIDNDASNDAENISSPARAKAIDRSSSASGVLAKVRGAGAAKRHGEASPLRAKDAGVRKTSGRVGSVGSRS